MNRTDPNRAAIPWGGEPVDPIAPGGRPVWPARALLIGFVLLIHLVIIHDRPFSRRDEPRVAGIARAMVLDRDLVTPRLNGEPFLEYPSLGYVPPALAFRAAGQATPWLAHLASALAGLGTVALVYALGRRLGGERLGLMAAFVLQSTLGFTHLTGRVLVDTWLLFWITFALFGFAAGYGARRFAFGGYALFYLGLAGALLTKGLVGLGLPAATAGVFLLVRRDLAEFRRLRPWWGVLIFAAPVAAWGAALYHAEGSGLVREVIRQSFWRFTSSTTDHAKPVYFYLTVIFIVLAPWSLYLPAVVWRNYAPRRWNRGPRPGPEALLPAVWFAVVFLTLSVASAKRNIYLAPLYPAFALLAASWWEQAAALRDRPRLERVLLGLTPVLGWLLLAAAAGIAFAKGGIPAGLGVTAGATMVLAVFRFLAVRSRRPVLTATRDRARLVAATAVLLVSGHFFFSLPSARTSSLDPLFTTTARDHALRPLVLYRPNESVRGAAVFFLGRRVPVAADEPALARWIHDHPATLILAEHEDRAHVERAAAPAAPRLVSARFRGHRRLELWQLGEEAGEAR